MTAVELGSAVVLGLTPPVLTRCHSIAASEAPSGARNLAAAAGDGWAVHFTHAVGWTQRKVSMPDYSIGDGTHPQLEVWSVVESVAVRMRHDEVGLRVVALFERLAEKAPASGAATGYSTPTILWWRIDLTTLGRLVQRAYAFPRQTTTTSARAALALPAEQLVDAFNALPLPPAVAKQRAKEIVA